MTARVDCRVLAALQGSQCADPSVAARLLDEVLEIGADGVVLEAHGAPVVGAGVDDLARFLEKAGKLDVVVAPYDLDAARQLKPFAFAAWKIDPALFTHLPLLEEIAADGRPVLAAVAGCTKRELDEAVCRLPPDATLVHTLTHLHSGIDVVDIAPMTALRQYGRPVGYADASPEVAAALVAVALGATVVQKPLTLASHALLSDRSPGLLAHEFLAFVAHVRRLERALASDGTRDPLPEECDAIEEDRVSIVALRAIPRGTSITRDMLTFRAPGTGLSPRFLPVVEGRQALYDIREGAPVTFGVIDL